MPARIVVVHDEHEFIGDAVSALRLAGHDVVAFSNSIVALNSFDSPEHVELLITRIRFPAGQPHGLSLALVLKTKRRDLKVLFTAEPEYAEDAEGVGEFVPLPISGRELVPIVDRILRQVSGR